MSKYEETAKKIIENIGGKANIEEAWHCVTRLRFNLKDKNQAKVDDIKKIPGVMGAQFSGEQFQVIVGNTVDDVFDEVEKIIGNVSSSGKTRVADEGVLGVVFDAISGIFTPIVPVLAGTGLLKGFLALAVIMGLTSVESETYMLLYGLADTVLYFFPIFVAIATAEKFKTSKYLSVALACAMIYPTYLGGAQAALGALMQGQIMPPWKMFGIMPVPLVMYTSSVLPIIFAVLLLKFVHKWVRSWMPKSLNLMFTPMIVLLIVFPITMVVIGPAGTYVGNLMAGAITWLFATAGPLAGVVLGATFPLLVITGMHYSLLPMGLTNLASKGYENTISPVNAVTNVAQSGAAFAVALRTKNTNMRQIAISSGISASIGITEPAMYGVNLKLRRPFYAALAGGGIAGGFAIFMNARTFGGGGMPGFLSIPSYINVDDRMNVIWFTVALLLSWILSFVFTIIFGFEDEVEENVVADKEVTTITQGEKHRVFSPINGKLVELKSVSDETFANGLIGKGIAIQASDENIYAPFTGTIKVFPESKHAIGMVSDDGVEVLIHIGIDTVELGGEGFNIDLKQEQRVEKGELLGTVDYDLIKEKGLDTVTIVVVTNTADYFEVTPVQNDGVIFKEEELIHVI